MFYSAFISKWKIGGACIFLGLLSHSFVHAQVQRVHQYQIKINAALSSASVKVCFDGKAPEYLTVDYRKAIKQLIQFPQTSEGNIEFQGRYWLTGHLPKNACINYQSDISEHRSSKRNNRLLTNKEGSPVKQSPISFQSDNSWLWLPEKLGDDEQVDIRFELPDNYRVSAPWKMLDHQGRHFIMGKAPHDWGFTLLIGDFQLQTIKIKSGGQVNVAVLNQIQQPTKLTEWVGSAANSLENYLGKFPVEQVQVILIENNRFRNSPVPWGDVKRGGGSGIRLVVDSGQPINSFYQDWTVTHEFAHLLLPAMRNQDMWISEGLASYMQYLLMAKSGVLSEQQAWQQLYQGFKRGLVATINNPEEILSQAIKNNPRGGAGRTKRIYWSGAAFFLMADVQLRQQSEGKVGLSQVLLKFNQCCSANQIEWSGLELSKQLDLLSKTTIFSDLFFEVNQSESFPDFNKTFAELGIGIDDEQVVLNVASQWVYRKHIMMPFK